MWRSPHTSAAADRGGHQTSTCSSLVRAWGAERPGGGDQRDLPWDIRGPEREADGSGPSHWRGQRFRPGSGRYGNSGGKHRDKFVVYHNKKVAGLRGEALEFWHPYQKDGYWELQARHFGIASPRDDRERAEKRQAARGQA